MKRSSFDLLSLVFRPLAQLCIRFSLPVSEVIEALKSTLVDEAIEELRSRGEKVTLSRVSVMLGMGRKDVTRLFRTEDNKRYPGENLSLLSRVLSLWQTDARFRLQDGSPKALECHGEQSEFADLVKTVSKDVHPTTFLKEFERRKYVKKMGRKVKLIRREHQFEEVSNRSLESVYRDVETLVRAVNQNLLENPNVRNLHLRTEYDNVFLEELPEIRTWMLEHGSKVHREAREYLVGKDKDLNLADKRRAGGRVVFVTYSYTESDDES